VHGRKGAACAAGWRTAAERTLHPLVVSRCVTSASSPAQSSPASSNTVVSTWESSVSSARAPPQLSFRTLWAARIHAPPGQAPCLTHRYPAGCAHTSRPRQGLSCRQTSAGRHAAPPMCDPARAHSLPPPDNSGGSASYSRRQARAGALGHRKPQHPTRERGAAPPAAPSARVRWQEAPAAAGALRPKQVVAGPRALGATCKKGCGRGSTCVGRRQRGLALVHIQHLPAAPQVSAGTGPAASWGEAGTCVAPW
jgi:hypothetical protein